jgi:hypothetical protein
MNARETSLYQTSCASLLATIIYHPQVVVIMVKDIKTSKILFSEDL